MSCNERQYSYDFIFSIRQFGQQRKLLFCLSPCNGSYKFNPQEVSWPVNRMLNQILFEESSGVRTITYFIEYDLQQQCATRLNVFNALAKLAI